MMNIKKIPFVAVLFALTVLSFASQARLTEPKPPADNPHTPTTVADIKRVDFAKLVIAKLLQSNLYGPDTTVDTKWVNSPAMAFEISETCLKSNACLLKNEDLKKFIHAIQNKVGNLQEVKHTHIIPWSFHNFHKSPRKRGAHKTLIKMDSLNPMISPKLKPDEFMMHSYVRFDKSSRWHHFDVIVSEDAQGNLEWRGFFVTVMPYDSGSLPPGVKC